MDHPGRILIESTFSFLRYPSGRYVTFERPSHNAEPGTYFGKAAFVEPADRVWTIVPTFDVVSAVSGYRVGSASLFAIEEAQLPEARAFFDDTQRTGAPAQEVFTEALARHWYAILERLSSLPPSSQLIVAGDDAWYVNGSHALASLVERELSEHGNVSYASRASAQLPGAIGHALEDRVVN